MNVKTRIKAGRLSANHSEAILRKGGNGLKVKTGVKAGRLAANHGETLMRPAPKKPKLK